MSHIPGMPVRHEVTDDRANWATVTLICGEGSDARSATHGRSWPIPVHMAGMFAEEMVERFGSPIAEILGTVGAMTAAAKSDAAEPFLIIDHQADGVHHDKGQ